MAASSIPKKKKQMSTEPVRNNIRLRKYPDRALMGEAAAQTTVALINQLLENQPEINMIFAAAPSQNEFLEALTRHPADPHRRPVPWSRVNAFHMDEYIGLQKDSPQSFAHYLREHLFNFAPFKTIHFLDGAAKDPKAECHRYAALLERFPPDIVCMGIGENNHIAFNDPPVADFKDPEMVKLVILDEACRRQQVNDGCFPILQNVPRQALTLTIPALLRASHIICVVPGERKAEAVYHTMHSPVSEKYPSTILTKHPDIQLFVDGDSGRLVIIN
jgi:glucosamine-6-phosphate deaminase